jgi:hypothetical protein
MKTIATRQFPHFVAKAVLSLLLLLAGAAARADAPEPIKLAIFEFELEDFSAGGSVLAASPSDADQLKRMTNDASQLIAQSGRYTVVDIGRPDVEAVRNHSLRNCDGCDADIAMKLGAQQSLVGFVTRISRTEYSVRFQIRDTRTGALVFNQQTGLRMGAVESWNRGAAWLIKNRLLQSTD